jgi:hypothetical protein
MSVRLTGGAEQVFSFMSAWERVGLCPAAHLRCQRDEAEGTDLHAAYQRPGRRR